MVDYKNVDEARLVGLSQKGDCAAFDELLIRNREKIYNMVLKKSSSPDVAEEVTQQASIKAWRKIETFRGESSFSTWFYRIGFNTFLDECRKEKRRNAVSLDEIGDMHGKGISPLFEDTIAVTGYHAVANKELGGQINDAIGELSPNHKKVLEAYEIENKNYKEIAKEQDCSIGTVMSRLFYARKNVRKNLSRTIDA